MTIQMTFKKVKKVHFRQPEIPHYLNSTNKLTNILKKVDKIMIKKAKYN